MNKTFVAVLLSWLPVIAHAQQEELRVNPDLGEETVALQPSEYSELSFLDLSSNAIQLNGADWEDLRRAFRGTDSAIVRILHIGDSHIQAEGATSRTRSHLQRHFGSAGRGLVAPLRIAGTNAPSDYSLKSASTFTSSRLLKKPWNVTPGFSGVAVKPESSSFTLNITCEHSFERMRIYSSGAPIEVRDAAPGLLAGYETPSDGITDVVLAGKTTDVDLFLHSAGVCSITAIELLDDQKGVEYSAIGNNGATFGSYCSIPDFGASVASLCPDLIVLSLGTNEAFGRTSNDSMRAQIHMLVEDIKAHNPSAVLLLTTPQECYRRSYIRRGKGRKRRRVRTYSVNSNVERMRNIISDYGKENGIAVYDWYQVAGGSGSGEKWLDRRLMNADRIHLTWDGYHLMGDLFANALLNEINRHSPDDI